MTRTLRTLIESRDFTGYTVQKHGWFLDADKIEELLYHRSYGDWDAADVHLTAFYENENITSVDINTWMCTDTYVGLQLLCLNDAPFALSWQTGRKSTRDIQLLNPTAHTLLANAWEKYRVNPKNNTDFVPDTSLDIPISGSNDDPYAIDMSCGIENLAIAAHSVAQWMEDIKENGGLASVHNPNIIRSCIQGVEFDIHMHQRSIDNTEIHLKNQKEKRDMSSVETTLGEFKERIELLTTHLLRPLQEHLAELEAKEPAS